MALTRDLVIALRRDLRPIKCWVAELGMHPITLWKARVGETWRELNEIAPPRRVYRVKA